MVSVSGFSIFHFALVSLPVMDMTGVNKIQNISETEVGINRYQLFYVQLVKIQEFYITHG